MRRGTEREKDQATCQLPTIFYAADASITNTSYGKYKNLKVEIKALSSTAAQQIRAAASRL